MSLDGAPNWKLVHFEVACARCGCDLRGLDEPRCPRCEFEFDWSEAVPLEELTCPTCGYHLCGLNDPRCPECGGTFAWNDVLGWYRRGKSPLFEHQWRRRPVRSFLVSVVKSLRPRRLWRQINIHDPVPVRPLLAMVLMVTTLSASLGLIVFVVSWWLRNSMVHHRRATAFQLSWLLQHLMWTIDGGAFVEAVVAGASWGLFTLAALLIFQESMRRYRVRTGHVVRVWAYAVTAGLVSIPVALFALSGALLLVKAGVYEEALAVVAFIPIIKATSAIHHGYRDYIKMDHSVAVAASSQSIAVLATLLMWLNVFVIK